MEYEFTDSVDTSADVDVSDIPDDIPEDDYSDVEDSSKDIPEDVLEEIPEDDYSDVEDFSEDISEDVPEEIPEDDYSDVEDSSKDIPEDVLEEIPEDDYSDVEDFSEDISEDVPEEIPEDDCSDVEDSSEDIPEDIPEKIPEDDYFDVEDSSEDIPEDVPEEILKDDYSYVEDSSEDIPEDIPENGYSDAEDSSEDIPEDVSTDETNNTQENVVDDSTEDDTTDTQEDAGDVSTEDGSSDIDDGSATDEINGAQEDTVDDSTEDDAIDTREDAGDVSTEDDNGDIAHDSATDEINDAQEDTVDGSAENDTTGTQENVVDVSTEDGSGDIADGFAIDEINDAQENTLNDSNEDATRNVDVKATAAEQSADVNDTEVNGSIKATTEGDEIPKEVTESDKANLELQNELSPMQQLSAYMNEHNYGPDNYAEYSKDPEWQHLHKDAFPDYYKDDPNESSEAVPGRHGDLDPEIESYHAIPNTKRGPDQVPISTDIMNDITSDTEPSAMQRLSAYMNEHNYGRDDFAEYSQDPTWRLLQKEAFPDYEMPQLKQENAQNQLAQFMNEHNYGADDLEEYSQNPVWRELHSAAYPNHEMPEYDSSPEARELREIGIPNVDLRDCKPEYRGDVVDAVKDAISEYPELRSQLSKVSCHDMPEGIYASYGPINGNKRFGGYLNLNSKNFSSPTLQAELTEESKQGWSIPNSTPKSIVLHELGHGMHLDLCAKSCGLEYGKVPDAGKFNATVQQYMNDAHADRIVEAACKDCDVEFDSWEFSDHLTRYGATNYGEALAEAVAEVRNSTQPRPMASAIYRHLKNYRV